MCELLCARESIPRLSNPLYAFLHTPFLTTELFGRVSLVGQERLEGNNSWIRADTIIQYAGVGLAIAIQVICGTSRPTLFLFFFCARKNRRITMAQHATVSPRSRIGRHTQGANGGTHVVSFSGDFILITIKPEVSPPNFVFLAINTV